MPVSYSQNWAETRLRRFRLDINLETDEQSWTNYPSVNTSIRSTCGQTTQRINANGIHTWTSHLSQMDNLSLGKTLPVI